MRNNNIYQYLDDLGTQEFLRVVSEVSMDLFDNRITDKVDENSTHDEIVNVEGSLNLLDRIDEKRVDVLHEVDRIKEILADIAGYLGIDVEWARQSAEKLTKLKIKTITGDINQVENPNDETIYFQHDNDEDLSWVIYIWNETEWLECGNVQYDLHKIWSKEETHLLSDRFYELALEPMEDEYIKEQVESAYLERVVSDYAMNRDYIIHRSEEAYNRING